MGENNRKMLEKEIETAIARLGYLKAETQDYTAAVDNLVTLYKLKLDEERIYMDKLEKECDRESDANYKAIQLKEAVKDRYFKVGIAAAELILPLVFYGIWMRRGFKFEETGTFTSQTFRGLFNRFKPTTK